MTGSHRLAAFALALACAGMAVLPAAAVPARAGQSEQPAQASRIESNQNEASRTEASQIKTATDAQASGPGSAYLDTTIRPAVSQQPSASVVQATSDDASRAAGREPAIQISASAVGGPAIMQLSKAELEATLAQLSPAERRVLLQAIDGSDICNDPPNVAAIIALCQSRLETRSAEFSALIERPLSAEDRLLRGGFEGAAPPTISQVIERLAKGSASSTDFSNQAIASIALGSSVSVTDRPREQELPDATSLGEETQALINALINQLGGRAP